MFLLSWGEVSIYNVYIQSLMSDRLQQSDWTLLFNQILYKTKVEQISIGFLNVD